MEVNNQKECNCKVSSFWDILLPAVYTMAEDRLKPHLPPTPIAFIYICDLNQT